jgi:hypothetical protein
MLFESSAIVQDIENQPVLVLDLPPDPPEWGAVRQLMDHQRQ